MSHGEALNFDVGVARRSDAPTRTRLRRNPRSPRSGRGTAITVTTTVSVAWVLLWLVSSPVQARMGQYLYSGEAAVKEYTGPTAEGNNFTLSTDMNRVVEFYSPYCGHCVHFKSTYLTVAKSLPDVEFYAVSCVAHHDVCQANNVRSWPSIYSFPKGSNEKKAWKGRGGSGFNAKAVEDVFADPATQTDSEPQQSDSPGAKPRDRAVERKAEGDGEDTAGDEGGDEDDADDKEDDTKEGEDDYAKDHQGAGDEETAHGSSKEMTAKAEEDDDDDNVDVGKASGNAVRRSPMQERIQEAHNRFVERKNLIDASLAAARKARLSKLEASGAIAGTSGVGPAKLRPGAVLAEKDTSDVNRFRNELSQKRKEKEPIRLFSRDRANSPPERRESPTGATVTMRANQLTTDEYKARREQLIASIRKHRGSARAKEVEAKLNEVENALDMNQNAARPAVLPFRKEVTKERIIERIPIVKRIVKMSHEEELILDVSMSFMQGLKLGVFKSRTALSQTEQVALEDWLHLMRVTLPSEWALHSLIDDLLDQFNTVVKSHEALVKVLERHPLHRDHWSLSCSPPGKVGAGFTCGFWKMLHVMSVGLAEHRGGEYVIQLRMARQDSVLFSPELAADTVREYITNFFPCTSCADHFTERFDDCSYRRCSRLSDKVSKTSDADWKELAKWLWEFHNEVSIRVLNERADSERKKRQRSTILRAEHGPGAAAVKDAIAVLYPSIHDCLTCFNGDGSWNEDAVFVFLERQYWPAVTMDTRTARLLTFEDDSGDHEFNLTVFLIALGLVLLYCLRDSLVGTSRIQEALLRARAMRPKMTSGSEKRSV